MTKSERIIEIKREARNTINVYYALMGAGILLGALYAIGKSKPLLTKVGYVLVGGAVVGVPATLITRNKLSNLLAQAQRIEQEPTADELEKTEKMKVANRVIEAAHANMV